MLESSLNHPPTPSVENLSSTKLISGAKMVEDHCFKIKTSSRSSLYLLSQLVWYPEQRRLSVPINCLNEWILGNSQRMIPSLHLNYSYLFGEMKLTYYTKYGKILENKKCYFQRRLHTNFQLSSERMNTI